jgi:dinuclear metal center YbgI/SA1388 family protein
MKRPTFTVSDILKVLEERAPNGTAEDWDNIGLLAGDPAWKTAGAVVCVDLNPNAIKMARAKGYRLIINHHPCIFPKTRGLSKVVADRGGGVSSLVFEALQHGIAVVAVHTNFDRCALEVVEAVSQGLGAKPLGRLTEKRSGAPDSLIKLSVFVPHDHLEKVRTAICEAGAGQIGEYDFCTFSVSGQGTFRGGKDTHPHIGKPGQLESAQEYRLETIFPKGLQKTVLKALFKAHPYEEVAFDLFKVEQEASGKGMVKGLGYGFWGDFPRPKSFSDVTRDVKRLFQVKSFWVTDPAPNRIKRIAFVAGKGGSFLGAALAEGCDLLITGEAGYHVALDGLRRGIGVIELGHRESELFFVSTMRGWLSEEGIKSADANQVTQKIV